MKAAVYVRVSTDRQAEEGMSIGDQLAACKKWCKEHGHTVVEIFQDQGSAYSFAKTRPEFERMINTALSDEKQFELIVVLMQSRFYRRNAEREILERELESHGVRVVTLGQQRPDDDLGAFMVRNFTGVFDEISSRVSGQRVAECMIANAKAGYFNGSLPPFGYQTQATNIPSRSGVKKILIVNESEAEVVREIFALSLSGKNGLVMGLKRITEDLNERGLLHRGVTWTMGHVEKILKNTAYIGRLVTFQRDTQKGGMHPQSEWVTTNVPQF
ncbi:recombinase family protein [Cupriavidus necator]|nr:recombinase family protein [Cupriavidus necator]